MRRGEALSLRDERFADPPVDSVASPHVLSDDHNHSPVLFIGVADDSSVDFGIMEEFTNGNFHRESTVDSLAHALRQSVYDGTLAPGEHLREVQIAKSYSVAVHTVRAAVQKLAREGVLRHSPHRGSYVLKLDREDVIDIFRLRAALEIEAVRLLITSGSAMTATRAAGASFDSLPDDASWERVVEADLAFHRGIIADTGSPRLARAYSAAQSEIQLCLAQLRPTFEHPSQESAEHHVLLDALVSGDVAAAEHAFRQHWHDSMESLLRILEAASTSEAGSASPEVAQALPKDLAGSEE